jgi:hypothetical protein
MMTMMKKVDVAVVDLKLSVASIRNHRHYDCGRHWDSHFLLLGLLFLCFVLLEQMTIWLQAIKFFKNLKK